MTSAIRLGIHSQAGYRFYLKLTPMKLLLYPYTSGLFVIWQKFKSHPCLVYINLIDVGLRFA